ncbi:hypothetical protein ACFLWX_04670, partial [Chloroflexota bacterium]
MELFFQMTLNGFMLGFTLLLIALGISLIWGVTGIPNLVHAEFFMIGAFMFWWLSVENMLPVWISIILVVLIVCGIGIAVEKFLLRPLKGDFINALIIAVGLFYIFQTSVLEIFGAKPKIIPQLIGGATSFGS